MANFNGLEMNSTNRFGAHNISLNISNSKISQNKRFGIWMENIAITSFVMKSCELIGNYRTAMHLEKVHHKSNKFKFQLVNTEFLDSKNHHGVELIDSGGFFIHMCKFNGNYENGIQI
jgi:hypothetical protein